jgi:hypothetical protein|tara:strand:- start:54 stop:359 length:306 start_codon:yes stop_codon:yes gene_type:complete
MNENITPSQLLTLINERDQHTQEKLVHVMDKLEQLANHMVISIEEKKHDDEFKREVRTHMKDSAPLLEYVREYKAVANKVRTAFFVSTMFAFLGLVGFSLK